MTQAEFESVTGAKQGVASGPMNRYNIIYRNAWRQYNTFWDFSKKPPRLIEIR
jgi:hypothetical protein